MASKEILQRLRQLWLSEPVKKAVIPLLNAASLYLLFPLHPGISIPALLAALGSIATWPSFGFSNLKSRTWSIVLLVAGLLWAILSPYFVPSGQLYFYRADSIDPRQAEILPLGDSALAGHLVYLTDPIRTSALVRKTMKLMGFRVEFLEKTPEHDPPLIIMPLSNSIRYRILGAGTATYGEELITSYIGTELAVSIYPYSKHSHGYRPFSSVGLAASNFPLVDYVRNVNNSPDLPWNAVAYSKLHVARAGLLGNAAQSNNGEITETHHGSYLSVLVCMTYKRA